MKILIFGGNGFLGLQLAKKLSEIDHKVTIFDKNLKSIKSRKIKFINEPLYTYQFTENPNKPRNQNDGGMRIDTHNSVMFIRNRGYLKHNAR